MEFLGIIIEFAVLSLIMGASLWAGMKITKVEGTFVAMLLIAAVTMLLAMIPGIGWIISLVALYFMLHKWTTAEFWPDSVILVVVAWAVRYVAAMILVALLVKLGVSTGG